MEFLALHNLCNLKCILITASSTSSIQVTRGYLMTYPYKNFFTTELKKNSIKWFFIFYYYSYSCIFQFGLSNPIIRNFGNKNFKSNLATPLWLSLQQLTVDSREFNNKEKKWCWQFVLHWKVSSLRLRSCTKTRRRRPHRSFVSKGKLSNI